MLLDTQCLLLFFVKALRLLLAWLALFVAGSVFTNLYVEPVYRQKAAPPPLALLVLMFVGIDAALNVLLWGVLHLVKYVHSHAGSSFVVDGVFMRRMVVDFAVAAPTNAAVGCVVAAAIQRRGVFNYAPDGVKSVHAFRDIMKAIVGFNVLMPYFAFLG